MVARASLLHQIRAATTATTTTIAPAARRSPLVRRSGGLERRDLRVVTGVTIGRRGPASVGRRCGGVRVGTATPAAALGRTGGVTRGPRGPRGRGVGVGRRR